MVGNSYQGLGVMRLVATYVCAQSCACVCVVCVCVCVSLILLQSSISSISAHHY